jgi:anti-sigma factor RsiW
MAKDKPLSEEEQENLVAYLDGELDEETSRAIEAKLSRDPRARAEAEALRQAWDLLDYLPKAEPSASFTNRTLDRVSAVRPSTTSLTAQQSRRRWVRRLGWVAAALVAVVVGWWSVGLLPDSFFGQPSKAELDEQLLRDLRVIENFRQYQNADTLHFLHELESPDLFGEDHGG